MKNLIKLTLITAMTFGVFSCSLDEEIEGDFTKDFDPNNQGVGIKNNVNKSGPNDGLQAAFSRLFSGTATNGGFFLVQELATDEAVITQKGGDWFDGGIFIRLHKHEFSPQTTGINDAWSHAYGGIFQCNDLLAVAGQSTANIAQLRTLRAYFYWRLLDLFGRVKIVTTAGVDAPQADRDDVYAFVESELLAVIPDLPPGKQEYARVSQGAAYALLSRLYLNANVYKGSSPEYQKAINAADMVINSGVYNLSPSYAAVFAPDNIENIEHIFIVPFDEATGTGMNFAQMTFHYPTQLTYRFQQQPWNGFSTLEEFYNSYDDNDLRKANNFIVGPQVDFDGNPLLDIAFDKADEDGPQLNYTPFINELFPNGSRQGGARFGKFAYKIGQTPEMDNDYPLLRYGEVLLNKAEAVARLNNNFSHPTTLLLVNELRDRAEADPFIAMTEGQLLAERGRELFLESIRRTDLIRFGAYGNAWWEKPAVPNPNFNVFAIPLEQIQAAATSTHKLTQNQGY